MENRKFAFPRNNQFLAPISSQDNVHCEKGQQKGIRHNI